MIIVTGTLHARPETLDQLLELSLEHVRRSRAEPGCIEHRVAADSEDPLRLVFFERWTERDAIATHLKLPASRGFGRAAASLVDRSPTLSVYEASELEMR